MSNLKNTKKRSLSLYSLVLITASSFLLLAAPAWANIPIQVPVQGLLADKEGQVVDGNVDILFQIYGDETSSDPIWQSEASLNVDRGLFEVYLGSDNTLYSDIFAAHPTTYLTITIDGDSESERMLLGTVPTAAHAISATYAEEAHTIQGKAPSQLFQDFIDETALNQAAQIAFDDSQSDLGVNTTQAALEALLQRVQALEAANNALQDQVGRHTTELAAIENDLTSHEHAITQLQGTSSTQAQAISTLQSNVASQGSAISSLQTKTASMAATTINGRPAVTFNGVNVYVRNGMGSTAGTPNGTGNLIVGYDEARTTNSKKTGSHNLVLGYENNYESFGGIVAGRSNSITGETSSVLGGFMNQASGSRSVIIAGSNNAAEGQYSVVVAGSNNTASGTRSVVVSGYDNSAEHQDAVVVAGWNNTASGIRSAVVAGSNNEAGGSYAAILSGDSNSTSSIGAAVVAGLSNTASGSRSAIVSGAYNTASATNSSVGSGRSQTASTTERFRAQGTISN